MILDLLINEVKDKSLTEELIKLKDVYIKLEEIIYQLDQYDIAYFIESQSLIEDYQYDLLKKEMYDLISKIREEMRSVEKIDLNQSNRDIIKRIFAHIKKVIKNREAKVGAKPNRKFKKAKHRRPMLSLSNCFTEDDVMRFMKNLPSSYDITCELKIDGVSFSAIYENGKLQIALTRGDGTIGEDITLNIKQIKEIPLEIDYKDTLEIRGEIYIDKETFTTLHGFSNPRNAASGSIRQLNPMITKERNLKYFVWDADFKEIKSHYKRILIAKQLGFCTNQYISLVKSISEMLNFYDEVNLIRPSLNYDIDGVVYKLDDITEQEKLGSTAHAPRWATAYKFQAKEVITEIKNIILQVGKSGVLIPVALVEPVNIGGALIKRVTLHNASELQRHDYRVGDIIKLIRSGDVIPKVNGIFRKNTTSNSFIFPEECPICSAKVVDDKTFTHKICTGGWSCKGQLIERLNHFVSRGAFNIIGLGHKQIEYLVKYNIINSYADIFKLNERNAICILQNHERWGDKSVSELFKSIDNARKIALNQFIYSLSIPHVGFEIANLLAQYSETYQNLISIINYNDCYIRLTSINGIGEQITKAVIEFFHDQYNILLLKELVPEIEILPYRGNNIERLYCCTGTIFGMTRTEVAEIIKNRLGGVLSNTITKKVQILIIGDKPSHAKIDQAKLLNIQLINQSEFIDLIKK